MTAVKTDKDFQAKKLRTSFISQFGLHDVISSIDSYVML